jgi:hypothetical protein
VVANSNERWIKAAFDFYINRDCGYLDRGRVSYIVNINNNKAPVNDVSPIDIKTHFEQRFCGQSVASIEDYVREFKIPGFCSLPLGIVMDRDDNV